MLKINNQDYVLMCGICPMLTIKGAMHHYASKFVNIFLFFHKCNNL